MIDYKYTGNDTHIMALCFLKDSIGSFALCKFVHHPLLISKNRFNICFTFTSTYLSCMYVCIFFLSKSAPNFSNSYYSSDVFSSLPRNPSPLLEAPPFSVLKMSFSQQLTTHQRGGRGILVAYNYDKQALRLKYKQTRRKKKEMYISALIHNEGKNKEKVNHILVK